MATAVIVAVLHLATFALGMMRPATRHSMTPPPTMVMIDVPPLPSPPPEPPAPRQQSTKPQGQAGSPGKHAKPTPVVAPPVPLPKPVPVVTAPLAGRDSASDAGATEVAGGTGAEGQGGGSGAGGSGYGQGAGGVTRARWLSGEIRNRDYPRAPSTAGVGGTVVAHFDVTPEGRVANCRVVRSSGVPELDWTTCRLLTERFRYAPARDAAGNPVTDVAGWQQDWWLEGRDRRWPG